MNAISLIKKHEGWEPTPYRDSLRVWTVGYGFNLEALDMPKPVGELWLSILVAECEDTLKGYSWFNRMNDARQNAIIDMFYNLGAVRFKQFKRMIRALENDKYSEAADEMLDSKWASQVGRRAEELAGIMREGK